MANCEAKVPVLFFQEGEKVIAYSPALDLCSCGADKEQARQRFTEAVAIFLNEITEMGTLCEVLEEYGWHKSPDNDSWTPPAYQGSTEEAVKIPVGS